MRTMPVTKTYAKVGKTAWLCTVWLDDGNDAYAEALADAEMPNLGLAKAWMGRNLRAQWRPGKPGRPWGRIERGTYEDTSFDAPEYGSVLDATWEPDGVEHYAGLARNNIDLTWDEG